MVGYPIYNNVPQKQEVYLSDIVVENSKYFYLGFAIAILTSYYMVNQSNKTLNTSTDKLGNLNPPSLFAVVGCLLLTGYCAGKLTTKGIDHFLGF
jgi:hypothetical protein